MQRPSTTTEQHSSILYLIPWSKDYCSSCFPSPLKMFQESADVGTVNLKSRCTCRVGPADTRELVILWLSVDEDLGSYGVT